MEAIEDSNLVTEVSGLDLSEGAWLDRGVLSKVVLAGWRVRLDGAFSLCESVLEFCVALGTPLAPLLKNLLRR